MTTTEHTYGVWLGDHRVGVIHQRGDYTRFAFMPGYLDDPARPVLGLAFEQDLYAQHPSALRLPPWFSNLLPEGHLREWIAHDRGVAVDREMELLAQVGHDLPGAVRVLPDDEPVADGATAAAGSGPPAVAPPEDDHPGWHFSLAGIALKFSMLAVGDRLTLPAHGEGGDWIVKLPDRLYDHVPQNEYAMMSLAGAAGIDVPEVRLVHRDQLDGVPENVWPSGEEWAYAVRRYDRGEHRVPIHAEDLAQVRGCYPDRKYTGNYETVASLIYRGRDIAGLREFARRLSFNILIANGDAHLKNWSLLYPDGRTPVLAPAYDLVATGAYRARIDGKTETLGLKFGGTKRFTDVSLGAFTRLQRKLNAPDAELPDHAADLVRKVREEWPSHADLVGDSRLVREVTESIQAHARSLLANSAT